MDDFSTSLKYRSNRISLTLVALTCSGISNSKTEIYQVLLSRSIKTGSRREQYNPVEWKIQYIDDFVAGCSWYCRCSLRLWGGSGRWRQRGWLISASRWVQEGHSAFTSTLYILAASSLCCILYSSINSFAFPAAGFSEFTAAPDKGIMTRCFIRCLL